MEHLDGDLILYQRNLATAAPNVKKVISKAIK